MGERPKGLRAQRLVPNLLAMAQGRAALEDADDVRLGPSRTVRASRMELCAMLNRKPILERAFELAASGQFRIPSQVRKALLKEGYTQSDVFTLGGKATTAQIRARCMKVAGE